MTIDGPAAASPGALADRRELAVIAVERTRMPMVVTDPRQPDNPIVLANRAFLDLTGYASDEVLGRNCRFLQGPDTCRAAVARLQAAVAEEQEATIELVNYRKDGSSFVNEVLLSPVRDDAGALLYFFGSQQDVSDQRRAAELAAEEHILLKEVDHRAKNVLALVQAIVRLSRADSAPAFAAAVQGRVQALARAHDLLSQHHWREVPLDSVVRAELEPYGRKRVELGGDAVAVVPQLVQPLALLLHEMTTNAAIHGALSGSSGSISVHWGADEEPGRVNVLWDEHGGPAPSEPRTPGFGSFVIKAIAERQLRGRVEEDWRPEGLKANISLPLQTPH